MADGITKSWFCVFNNPEDHGYTGTPMEITDRILNEWAEGNPTRSCAATFCLSADGMPHIHAVFEDSKAMRFSVIKKTFPSMHIEPTKGNKDEAEDYIHKRGKWEEKGEKIIYSHQIGEIKGAQGTRRDIGIIEELIDQGKTPGEILDMSFSFRRYENMIKSAYFAKRSKETPFFRDVQVIWHVGDSGSGKTYTSKHLVELHGEDSLYLVNDYSSGGMDAYMGQKILFLDEFRGQLPYHVILSWFDGYKVQVHARYSNVLALWEEVHVSSVLPPESTYDAMVFYNRNVDSSKQLFRRINKIVYHWKDSDGYHQYELDAAQYRNLEDLRCRALGVYDVFQPLPEYEQQTLPFANANS